MTSGNNEVVNRASGNDDYNDYRDIPVHFLVLRVVEGDDSQGQMHKRSR